MPLLEFDINIIDIIINYYTIDYRHIFKFLFLSKYINYKNIIKLSLQPNNTYDYKYYYFNISKIYNTLYKCINLELKYMRRYSAPSSFFRDWSL